MFLVTRPCENPPNHGPRSPGSESFAKMNSSGSCVPATGVAEDVGTVVALDAAEAAEVAVTVADEWQHRGVGTLLLRRLVVLAESHGIDHFTALCFATNADMLLLLRELDENIHRIGSGQGAVEVEVHLPVDAEHLISPTLSAVARAPELRGNPLRRDDEEE